MLRHIMRALLCALSLALVAPASVAAPPDNQHLPQTVASGEAIGTKQVELGRGHIDFGPRIVDGSWVFLGRDDTVTPPVWRHPRDLIMRVNDHSLTTVPDSEQYNFLPAGKKVYVIPQTQDPKVVWVGWSTQDPAVVEQLDRGAWLEFRGVAGPGRFVTFIGNGFDPPTVLWDSAKPSGQKIWVNSNTHTHLNWAFEAPGQYTVGIDLVAKLKNGQDIRVPASVTYLVGDATVLSAQAEITAAPAAGAPAAVSSFSIWWWAIGAGALLLAVIIVVRLVSTAKAKKAAKHAGD